MKRICSIYKSPRKNEMYLYVLKADGLERVPEAAAGLWQAGACLRPGVDPERQLAREDITQVLANLEKQGYHLQMPPLEDEYIEHLPEELLRRNDPV